MVNISFIVCAGTGPTLGVIFGGWLIDRTGGYKDIPKTLKTCLLLGVMAVCFALALIICRTFHLFIIFLWFLLFFGAAVLPSCAGILVTVVPPEYRAVSSSVAVMVFNLFGYFMSLTLSGYLMQILLVTSNNCDLVCARVAGFRMIMTWSLFSLFFLVAAIRDGYRG
jgi:MFS family permease